MERVEVLGKLYEIAPKLRVEHLYGLVGAAHAYEDCERQFESYKKQIDAIKQDLDEIKTAIN